MNDPQITQSHEHRRQQLRLLPGYYPANSWDYDYTEVMSQDTDDRR